MFLLKHFDKENATCRPFLRYDANECLNQIIEVIHWFVYDISILLKFKSKSLLKQEVRRIVLWEYLLKVMAKLDTLFSWHCQ